MEMALVTSSVSAGVVIAVAAYLRTWLVAWVGQERTTRLMPLVVVLLSLGAVLAARLLPVPAADVLEQWIVTATGAMGLYSGTKAVVGAS